MKIVLLLLLTFLSSPSFSLTKEQDVLLKHSLYSNYCGDKNHIKQSLTKELIPNAVSSLKEKDAKKHKEYLLAIKQKTILYKVQRTVYRGYDKDKVYCLMILALKPNKKQEDLDIFLLKYYLGKDAFLLKNMI